MPADATEIEAQSKAINDASGKLSVLWTTFVTFELYLAIAFGSVTHQDILLENSVKLPIMNVDLPLVAFSLVAPTIFVIFHFYVQLQFTDLISRCQVYNDLLFRQFHVKVDRMRMRQRLDSFVILRYLASLSEARHGLHGLCLSIVIVLTLIMAPLAILLQAQITFLPYHSQICTNVQRVAILLDVLIISAAAYCLLGIDGSFNNKIKFFGVAISFALSSLVMVFSLLIITFPGEWADNLRQQASKKSKILEALHERLFGVLVNREDAAAIGPFTNRIILPDQNLSGSSADGKIRTTLSFRGRDLRSAVLSRSSLRGADFSGANLDAARIEGANLEGSRFNCLSRTEDLFSEMAQSGCASLKGAQLRGAQLQRSSLVSAQLQGASLRSAVLQDSSLKFAQLQGASLDFAVMKGASLEGANLRGASLDNADLQGASLNSSRLQGASLKEAHLQGALLKGAGLQGASLDQASMQGASLDSALLQGASLKGTEIQGAWFNGAFVWRAAINTDTDIRTAVFGEINCSSPFVSSRGRRFRKKINNILRYISQQERRDQTEGRLSDLNVAKSYHFNGIDYRVLCAADHDGKFGQRTAEYLVDTACSSESAPYPIRGLLAGMHLDEVTITSLVNRLRRAKIHPSQCPSATALTEQDWKLIDWFLRNTTSYSGETPLGAD